MPANKKKYSKNKTKKIDFQMVLNFIMFMRNLITLMVL